MPDEAKDLLRQRVHNDLGFHPGTPETAARFTRIRVLTEELANAYIDNCPPGRDLSTALTHLEEAQHWAIGAIAKTNPSEVS